MPSISHLWKFGESSSSKFDEFQELMQVFVSGSVWCDVMHKIYHPCIVPDVKKKRTVKNKMQVLKNGVLLEGVSQIYLDIGAPPFV